MKKLFTLLLISVFAGCSTAQTGGTALTPAQQCQVYQTAALSAETTVLSIHVKNVDAQKAIDAALVGVTNAANAYCEAVARGETPDGLTLFLNAFNAALADLNRQLRESRV